jgi:SOS-response transcriptional repressor LexA
MAKNTQEPLPDGGGCALQEPFALQVLGPDMEPEFPDKCIVVIEPTEICRSGMYVFAEVEGTRWFRQYVQDEQGRERLVALNEIFPDIDLKGLDWKVLGVIIQRNIRRKIKTYEYPDGPSNRRQSSINAVDITAS